MIHHKHRRSSKGSRPSTPGSPPSTLGAPTDTRFFPVTEHEAATRLQNAERGRQARNQLLHRQIDVLDQLRGEENRAATKLQAMQRGRIARRQRRGRLQGAGAHSTVKGTARTDGMTDKQLKADQWARQAQVEERIRMRKLDAKTGKAKGTGALLPDGSHTMQEDHKAWVAAQAKNRKDALLKERRKQLTDHWATLDENAGEYGQESAVRNGRKMGLSAAASERLAGRQLATWQNGLGDFAASPSVCCASICCCCVQFGVNTAAVYDGYHERHCCTAQRDTVRLLPWCKCAQVTTEDRRCCIQSVCVPYAMCCLVLWPLVGVCGGACARYRLRKRLGIRGTLKDDCATHCGAPCCAIIQEGNELAYERQRRHAEARAQAHIMRMEGRV